MALAGKRILLIIAGGIAAYKSLDLIRRLRDEGASVRCLLTEAGKRFVTPLSVSALSGHSLSDDLFAADDDAGMAHITLSRQCDVILVAPATADLMAKMAHGLADDLASTTLLAADKPILLAPAMNAQMWAHAATQDNYALLLRRGVTSVGPAAGDLACGEVGSGRMAEVPDIIAALGALLAPKRLSGRRALVTSGPTFEAIDPVRFIGNRSSGKQGHAIAAALQQAGAAVTLVRGPVGLADPPGVTVVKVETGLEMQAACLAALPVDIAVCAAAVADWRVTQMAPDKLKKAAGPPQLALTANPDILAGLARHRQRPRLLIGFAAETGSPVDQARAKLAAKGCDLIVANDVSIGQNTFGGDDNQVWLVAADGVSAWPPMSKAAVAARLVDEISARLS